MKRILYKDTAHRELNRIKNRLFMYLYRIAGF